MAHGIGNKPPELPSRKKPEEKPEDQGTQWQSRHVTNQTGQQDAGKHPPDLIRQASLEYSEDFKARFKEIQDTSGIGSALLFAIQYCLSFLGFEKPALKLGSKTSEKLQELLAKTTNQQELEALQIKARIEMVSEKDPAIVQKLITFEKDLTTKIWNLAFDLPKGKERVEALTKQGAGGTRGELIVLYHNIQDEIARLDAMQLESEDPASEWREKRERTLKSLREQIKDSVDNSHVAAEAALGSASGSQVLEAKKHLIAAKDDRKRQQEILEECEKEQKEAEAALEALEIDLAKKQPQLAHYKKTLQTKMHDNLGDKQKEWDADLLDKTKKLDDLRADEKRFRELQDIEMGAVTIPKQPKAPSVLARINPKNLLATSKQTAPSSKEALFSGLSKLFSRENTPPQNSENEEITFEDIEKAEEESMPLSQSQPLAQETEIKKLTSAEAIEIEKLRNVTEREQQIKRLEIEIEEKKQAIKAEKERLASDNSVLDLEADIKEIEEGLPVKIRDATEELKEKQEATNRVNGEIEKIADTQRRAQSVITVQSSAARPQIKEYVRQFVLKSAFEEALKRDTKQPLDPNFYTNYVSSKREVLKGQITDKIWSLGLQVQDLDALIG